MGRSRSSLRRRCRSCRALRWTVILPPLASISVPVTSVMSPALPAPAVAAVVIVPVLATDPAEIFTVPAFADPEVVAEIAPVFIRLSPMRTIWPPVDWAAIVGVGLDRTALLGSGHFSAFRIDGRRYGSLSHRHGSVEYRRGGDGDRPGLARAADVGARGDFPAGAQVRQRIGGDRDGAGVPRAAPARAAELMTPVALTTASAVSANMEVAMWTLPAAPPPLVSELIAPELLNVVVATEMSPAGPGP